MQFVSMQLYCTVEFDLFENFFLTLIQENLSQHFYFLSTKCIFWHKIDWLLTTLNILSKILRRVGKHIRMGSIYTHTFYLPSLVVIINCSISIQQKRKKFEKWFEGNKIKNKKIGKSILKNGGGAFLIPPFTFSIDIKQYIKKTTYDLEKNWAKIPPPQ